MRFLLYSLNYSPELTGIGKYNGEMCEYFQGALGWDVSAIVAKPYYPEWKVHESYKGIGYYTDFSDSGVKVIRCPHYVPKKVSTLKRILHLASFAITSFLPLLKQFIANKPEVIFVVQPTLAIAPAALVLSKLFGVRSVMHIQDYELDAMLGLGLGKSGFIANLAKKVERFILKQFDAVTTISNSMVKLASEKGVDSNKVGFFPNWADVSFVTPDADGSQLKGDMGFSEADFVCLYSGNIGEKQGLDVLLEVAQELQEHNAIKFLLVGNGAYKDALKGKAIEKGLRNVEFRGLLPWEQVPELLSMADLHLVIQKRGAADIVLPSKLTNILASGGHAIVTAEENTELGEISSRFPGIYSLVAPECAASLKAAIELAFSESKPGKNIIARNYAESFLDTSAVLNNAASLLKS